MVKLKPCSVQEVAFWWQRRETSSATAAVCVISNHRMPDRCEMHPYLVRPSGKEMSA